MTASHDQLKSQFSAGGQAHVFDTWSSLSPEEQSKLINQLKAINVPRINSIFNTAMNSPAAKGTTTASAADHGLQPLPDSSFDSTINADPAKLAAWRSKGLELIAQGKVGVILLAGGQGTRLGSSAPKGCYDIGLPSHKSLFQMQAERILKVRALAAAEFPDFVKDKSKGPIVPWYVMTSGPTRAATEEFFKEKNYFGVPIEDIFFFEQGTLPAFTNNGKIFMESQSSLALAPDGNGGIYAALEKEGVLDDLEKRGIPYVHAYCVDNCLVKVADPVFIGYCVSKNADCGAKSVPKVHPDESVGVICLRNNKFGVVEYSEIPKEVAQARRGGAKDGPLLYSAANIANHFYTTAFLRRVKQFEDKLEYHVARKKIKHYDHTTGKLVSPDKANGVKLELFIFDVFPFTERMAVLEVERKEEFSPLKNAPGAKEGDSPDTSRRDLLEQGRRFLEKAGAVFKIPLGEGGKGGAEVDASVSYDGEGLGHLKGVVFDGGNAMKGIHVVV